MAGRRAQAEDRTGPGRPIVRVLLFPGVVGCGVFSPTLLLGVWCALLGCFARGLLSDDAWTFLRGFMEDAPPAFLLRPCFALLGWAGGANKIASYS